MISIASVKISEQAKQNVMEVLDSGMLASGKWVEEFESNFAKYLKVDSAIATSSGTTALQAALVGLGIGHGDTVAVPSFTYIASASVISHSGACPAFVDSDLVTFNIDVNHLEEIVKVRKPKAVIVVHMYGLPCEMPAILELSNKYGFYVIEDCAHAIGASINGKRVGTFGDAAAFSLYATKNLGVGEGGMVVFKDKEKYDYTYKMVNHGRESRYVHSELGYNWRMTNITAALGLDQLTTIDKTNLTRAINAEYFQSNINHDKVRKPWSMAGYRHVYHQYTLKVDQQRDSLIEHLKECGVGTGIFYPIPVHQQPAYQKLHFNQYLCEKAQYLASHNLAIPIHQHLSADDLKTIVNGVNTWSQ